MENNAKLRDRLQEAMDLRGLRAVDIVERTGIPKGAISYYLSGRSKPKADRLHILAKALDVSEAWLLGFDVDRNRTPEQKKNDQLAQLIVRLRRDPDFFGVVQTLAELPAEQYDSVKQLLTILRKK